VYNNVEGSNAKQSIYSTTLGMRGNGNLLQSASQNAWERQLTQTSVDVDALRGQQNSIANQLGNIR